MFKSSFGILAEDVRVNNAAGMPRFRSFGILAEDVRINNAAGMPQLLMRFQPVASAVDVHV
jgi:hypothetical protein